jgi:DNA-directed RNA polymerase subunit RPC12/RpoP
MSRKRRRRVVPLSHHVAEGIGIWLTCLRCGRSAAVAVELAIARWGPEATLDDVRGRCTACGSREVETHPDWRRAKGQPQGPIAWHGPSLSQRD